jgi:hypothetical protein
VGRVLRPYVIKRGLFAGVPSDVLSAWNKRSKYQNFQENILIDYRITYLLLVGQSTSHWM